jgi:hypothetical protein
LNATGSAVNEANGDFHQLTLSFRFADEVEGVAFAEFSTASRAGFCEDVLAATQR